MGIRFWKRKRASMVADSRGSVGGLPASILPAPGAHLRDVSQPAKHHCIGAPTREDSATASYILPITAYQAASFRAFPQHVASPNISLQDTLPTH